MTKRGSLFGSKTETAAPPAAEPAPVTESRPYLVAENRRYPVAKTRENKRVATVYLAPEVLMQLKVLAAKEETTLQELLVEGVNKVFESRQMGRLA